eukprot:6804597-Pyramimonas_sp.AAC.1
MERPRLCFDVLRAWLRSNRPTLLGKGCVKSLVRGAFWAPSRALERGHQVEPTKCVRCNCMRGFGVPPPVGVFQPRGCATGHCYARGYQPCPCRGRAGRT